MIDSFKANHAKAIASKKLLSIPISSLFITFILFSLFESFSIKYLFWAPPPHTINLFISFVFKVSIIGTLTNSKSVACISTAFIEEKLFSLSSNQESLKYSLPCTFWGKFF